jgi:hypothetical protein
MGKVVTISQPDYGSVVLTFGVHDGSTISQVFDTDPRYLYWLAWKSEPYELNARRFRSYARRFLSERRKAS